MNEAKDLLLPSDLYKVLRLVMVNSGSAAFIEIPLDKTAALLSKNNKGKTSALNALKLFLLPEVNFRNCESKFGFSSGGKLYSGLDSFSYYFPSARSFIILEASNPQGDFCIVLHQNPKEELGYGRIAIAQPFAKIRHLFWDADSGKNQGMGSHPDNLSLSYVQKQLLSLKALALNDVESIRNALFTRVSLSKPETRYCLMPLVQEPKPSVMRTIKSLLQLSFDIKGASTENLPKAIANIIDGDVASGRDAIHIDFKKIQADKQNLQQEAQHIAKVKGHGSDWQSLLSAYDSFKSLNKNWWQQYQQLDISLQQLEEKSRPQQIELAEKKRSLDVQKEQISTEKSKVQGLLAEAKGQSKVLARDLTRLNEQIELAQSTIARERPVLDSSDPLEIAQHLSVLKQQFSDELENYKDKSKAAERQEKLLKTQQQLQQRIERLEQDINNQSSNLLQSLNDDSARILNSLNPDFKRLNTRANNEQQQAIEGFTALFNEQGERLHFCGELLLNTPSKSFDARSLKEEREGQLTEYLSEKRHNDKELTNLKRLLDANESFSLNIIDDKQREIDEVSSEINALSAFASNQQQQQEKQIELSTLEENIAQGNEQSELLIAQQQDLQFEIDDVKQQLHRAEKELSMLGVWRQQLRTQKLATAALSRSNEAIEESAALDSEKIPQAIQALENCGKALADNKEQVAQHFRKLINLQIIHANADIAYPVDLESTAFADALQKLRSEFDNIDSKDKEHRAQISNHNHETSNQMSMLDSMERAIRNFETTINLELQQVHISNLSSIAIQIKTLDAFNTLRKDLQRHGNTSDHLMDDYFYQRLADFSDKYLVEGAGRGKLDLEKIIIDVQFIYEIDGRKESTSQSTGTNGMVNAVLLAILMRRLVPEDVSFTLPVVFDEIGSLDEDNLPELRRVVEENRFVLLVANPNNNGYIAQYIGRWHDIYLHHLTEGEAINEKCLAIYLADTESLQKISDLAQA